MISVSIKTPPPSTAVSIYQASTYSSYSQPHPYPSLNNSCERLLPQKKVTPQSKLRYVGPRTSTAPNRPLRSAAARRRMSTTGGVNAVEIEQKKSYGIGGAGNIRRPSDVIYPPRTNPDGTRRRSSVWSNITTISPSSSPEGKRNSLMSLFRRGSTGPAVGEGNIKGYKEANEVEHDEH